jgi:DNA-directed RNA polymerase alpha subunit
MEQRRRNFREFDDIYRKYGKRFRFPVYLGEEFMETPLDNLELSVRSYNCLWRAGIRNVGNIVNRIDNRTDLLHIRNLGIRSADEIMTALMEYQFSLLSDEGKKKYLARIDELNGKDNKRLTNMQGDL